MLSPPGLGIHVTLTLSGLTGHLSWQMGTEQPQSLGGGEDTAQGWETPCPQQCWPCPPGLEAGTPPRTDWSGRISCPAHSLPPPFGIRWPEDPAVTQVLSAESRRPEGPDLHPNSHREP